jgi:rhodanese-related sulfurtransferase
MKRLILLTLSCLSLLSAAEPAVKHVDAAEAAKLVAAKKVTVLDVRTAEEFADGHIEGAVNADFTGKDFAKQAAAVDKATPVLVHCAAGGRSTRSLPQLEALGFKILYHLDGGLGAWTDAGKPVVK